MKRWRDFRRKFTHGITVDLCTLPGSATVWRADTVCDAKGTGHATEIGGKLFVPPLVRDRKTQRAMKKPTGPAGTRAWHKRPLAAIMGKIDRETVMTRARLCFQREVAVARLRGIPKPIIRHLVRRGFSLPLNLHLAESVTMRGLISRESLRRPLQKLGLLPR